MKPSALVYIPCYALIFERLVDPTAKKYPSPIWGANSTRHQTEHHEHWLFSNLLHLLALLHAKKKKIVMSMTLQGRQWTATKIIEKHKLKQYSLAIGPRV